MPAKKGKKPEAPVKNKMDRESANSTEDRFGGEVEKVRLGDPNPGFFKLAHLVWWILCVGGMIITAIIGNAEGTVHALLPVDRLALYIFQSRDNLKIVFNLAVLAHVIEAQMAVYICLVELRLQSWPLWGIQTLCLGYPSLSLLLERRHFLKAHALQTHAPETEKNK